MKKRINTHKKRGKTKFFLSEGQMGNVILAARGQSDCPAAQRVVKKLDKRYKLKKK